jgi:glutamyl-tRNA synthetase
MTEPLRVRFAPSPTGNLHVGGARTAIYNWALARGARLRGEDSAFVLRIEDTDPSRSTSENTAQILRSLRWLGLSWDEGLEPDAPERGDFGPYLQTERAQAGLYEQDFIKLKSAGLVYEEQDDAHGSGPAYRLDVKSAWPEPTIEFDDLVYGHISVAREQVEDFIIVRSDGSPTYNFAVVCDDARMRINTVVRGDDHISNTPKQLILYRALGYPQPRFAHLSMILGSDGKRLSKRHGATSVEAYQEAGYLPAALLNYLSLLGWAPDGQTTLFGARTLCERFDLRHVSRNPATFDTKKLNWINQQYIKAMGASAFVDAWLPFLQAYAHEQNWILPDDIEQRAWYEALYPLICERIDTLAEAAPKLAYLFSGEQLEMDEKSVVKILRGGGGTDAAEKAQSARTVLQAAQDTLGALRATWNLPHINAALDALLTKLDLKPKAFWQPLRVAICGNMVSPPLNESIALLDLDLVLTRLSRAAQLCA